MASRPATCTSLQLWDQLEYTAPEIWISLHTGRVRVRVGQVNRISSAISGAVYSN